MSDHVEALRALADRLEKDGRASASLELRALASRWEKEAGEQVDALLLASNVLGWIVTIESPDDWPSAITQAREAEIVIDKAPGLYPDAEEGRKP